MESTSALRALGASTAGAGQPPPSYDEFRPPWGEKYPTVSQAFIATFPFRTAVNGSTKLCLLLTGANGLQAMPNPWKPLDLPQTFTALHKNLSSPSSTFATAPSKDGISPSPSPMLCAPCWKILTMEGSRGKGSTCVPGPGRYCPSQPPRGITCVGMVGCSASPCREVLRRWSWSRSGTFYQHRFGWEISSEGFSFVSIAQHLSSCRSEPAACHTNEAKSNAASSSSFPSPFQEEHEQG